MFCHFFQQKFFSLHEVFDVSPCHGSSEDFYKMAEDSLLNSLIEKEIPEGRQALIDSHKNLAELAAYCKENYRQNSDKAKVLAETKQYASQSLASVAYQVHSLAVNMLQMMDQQMIQLKKMESDVDNVSLVCNNRVVETFLTAKSSLFFALQCTTKSKWVYGECRVPLRPRPGRRCY